MMSSWRKLKKVQQSSSFSVTPTEQAFWFKLISVRLYENDVSVRSTCGGGGGWEAFNFKLLCKSRSFERSAGLMALG